MYVARTYQCMARTCLSGQNQLFVRLIKCCILVNYVMMVYLIYSSVVYFCYIWSVLVPRFLLTCSQMQITTKQWCVQTSFSNNTCMSIIPHIQIFSFINPYITTSLHHIYQYNSKNNTCNTHNVNVHLPHQNSSYYSSIDSFPFHHLHYPYKLLPPPTLRIVNGQHGWSQDPSTSPSTPFGIDSTHITWELKNKKH